MQFSKNYPPKRESGFDYTLDGLPARLRPKGYGVAIFAAQKMVGVPGFEPGTSSLSGTRSNQLSYTPDVPKRWHAKP